MKLQLSAKNYKTQLIANKNVILSCKMAEENEVEVWN